MTLTVDQVKALPLYTPIMVNRIGTKWHDTLKGKRLETLQKRYDGYVTVDDHIDWDYVESVEGYETEYEEVPQ